jgi:predicted Zn-dependent protease
MQLRPGHGRILWLTLLVLLLGGAALSLSPARERNPDRLWARAEEDFRAGRYKETEAALARLAGLRAPTSLDHMLQAQLFLARKREDDALAALAQIPDTEPIAPQARLLAGQVELRRSRLPAAERFLVAATTLDPKLVQAHRELIYIYGMQLRRPELNARFRALSELSTLTFDNAFHWCLTRYNVWEATGLLPELERFLRADPDDRWSRVALAECLRRLVRLDDAEKALKALSPDDPEVLVVRARLALDRGDDRAAAEVLAKGPPDHPDLARLRGKFALSHHDYEAAVRHFRAAYAADPDNRDGIFGLARALNALGRKEEAEPFMEASRKYDALGSLLEKAGSNEGKKDPTLPRRLGAACERVDRLPEARAWLKIAIAANPLDAEAQQALFRVESKLGRVKGANSH